MGTICLLLFFSHMCAPLWAVASLITIGYYAICDFGKIIALTMFFAPLSGIKYFYVVSLAGAFLVVSARYIFEAVNRKVKVFWKPLGLTIAFIAVFAVARYNFNGLGFEQGGMSIALLFGLYLCFVYAKTINVHKCFMYLLLGLAVSSGLGIVSLLFKNVDFSIVYDDGIQARLELFCFHMNHLAMFAAFEIAYLTHSLINKKHGLVLPIVGIVFSLILGLATLSKAFILICGVVLAYALVVLMIKLKKQAWKVILPLSCVLLVSVVVFWDVFEVLFSRFVAYNKNTSLLNQITTGRMTIWKEYLKDISSSIPKMLFGVGLFNAPLNEIGPHNVLLFFARRVGLIGIIFLGLIVYSYFEESHFRIKATLSNSLLFVVYFAYSLEEMIFSDRFIFFLVFAILLMAKGTEDGVVQNQEQQFHV